MEIESEAKAGKIGEEEQVLLVKKGILEGLGGKTEADVGAQEKQGPVGAEEVAAKPKVQEKSEILSKLVESAVADPVLESKKSAEDPAERDPRHRTAHRPPTAPPARPQLEEDETFTVSSSISWPFWIA